MATKVETLSSFHFDGDGDNQDFFGITPSGVEAKTREGLKGFEDDDDEDDKPPTKFEEDAKGNGKAKEEEEEVETTVVTKKVAPVEKKEVKEVKEETKAKKEEKSDADDDDDDEDVEFTFGAKPKDTISSKKEKEEAGQNTPTEKSTTSQVDEEEFFSNMASDLKDRGWFQNVEIPKEGKITEEQFFDLTDKEVETRLDESLESLVEELGEDGRDLVRHMKAGGKIRDFVHVYAENSFDLEEFDETNPKHVDKVIKYYVDNYEEGDEEDKADRLAYIKDGGKSKSFATKWYKVIVDSEKKIKEDFVAEQEAQILEKEKVAKATREKVEKVLKGTTAVGVFPISKEEQLKLGEYINKPTIKVGKNKYVPPLIAKIGQVLRAGTEEDVQKLLVIAKLFYNDFDIKDLVTETTTKVTAKVKEGVAKGKLGMRVHASSGNGIRKSLTDYFPDE